MDARPIGIFDSGLGGLSAAKVLERIMPDEDFIYFGDSANAPYGGRGVEDIRRLALANGRFMASMGVKSVLVACGTVSSTAMDVLEENFDIPFFGVVEPACALAAGSGCRRVAVIATEASIKSGVYERRLRELMPGAEIMAKACPKLVPAVEAGHFAQDDAVAAAVVAEELGDVRDFEPEMLILGCTHFPFLDGAIADFMGPDTRLLSVSEAAARSLEVWLSERDMKNPHGGSRSYYTSDDRAVFEKNAALFMGHPICAGKRAED